MHWARSSCQVLGLPACLCACIPRRRPCELGFDHVCVRACVPGWCRDVLVGGQLSLDGRLLSTHQALSTAEQVTRLREQGQ